MVAMETVFYLDGHFPSAISFAFCDLMSSSLLACGEGEREGGQGGEGGGGGG